MLSRSVLRLSPQTTIVGRSLFFSFAISGMAFGQDKQTPDEARPQTAAPAHTTNAVSLSKLLEFAEQNAPALRTAQARVGLADASVTAASPWFSENPELSGSLGARTSDGNSGLEYEIGIAQKLEVAGERGLRKKAARAEAAVAAKSSEEVRWQIHVEVHRLHNELLLLEQRRAQAERFVAFSESLQKIAVGQVKAGESSPLTLLVADADVAETKSSLLDIQQQEATTRTNLAGLVGWPRAEPLAINGTLPGTTRSPDTETLLRLMAKHHPSLQTRNEAVNASRTRLQAERRSAWPKPTVGASYGREPGLAGQPNTDIWLFNISVPLPVWQRNQGGVAKADAELDLALSQQAEVMTRLESDLLATANGLNSAAAQVELYETSVIPQLEKNLLALQRAYQLGEVDLLQVSQTRQRLLEGSKRYLDARIAYFRAAASLEGHVGSEIVPHTKDKQ